MATAKRKSKTCIYCGKSVDKPNRRCSYHNQKRTTPEKYGPRVPKRK